MAYPFKVRGGCFSTIQKVFKIRFTKELSAVPQLKAYDNSSTYPSTSTDTTTNYTVFQGTSGNGNKSMLHCVDNSISSPATQGWHTQSVSGAGVATCLMKGSTSYLQFRIGLSTLNTGNPSLYWNTMLLMPYDVNPTMTISHNFVVSYMYTGTAPTVQFFANNETAGGTSATPIWGTIGSDSQGILFGRATATNSSILINVPLTGQELSYTAWVTSVTGSGLEVSEIPDQEIFV